MVAEEEEEAADKRKSVKQSLAEALLEETRDAGPLLEKTHPADVANWLQDLEPEDARRAFEKLDTPVRAEVIEYAEDALQETLIEGLPSDEIAEIVDELPTDEGVRAMTLAHVNLGLFRQLIRLGISRERICATLRLNNSEYDYLTHLQ